MSQGTIILLVFFGTIIGIVVALFIHEYRQDAFARKLHEFQKKKDDDST